jgi:hypothetical protein
MTTMGKWRFSAVLKGDAILRKLLYITFRVTISLLNEYIKQYRQMRSDSAGNRLSPLALAVVSKHLTSL